MTSNEISLIKQALLIVELREVRLMDSFPTIDADHSQEYLENINKLTAMKKHKSTHITFSSRKLIACIIAAALLLLATACAFYQPILNYFQEIYSTFTKFSTDEDEYLNKTYYLKLMRILPESFDEESELLIGEVVNVSVDDSILEKTLLSVKEATSSKKSHFGVMFTVNVSEFIRSGNPNQEKPEGENNMAQNESYKLINVIVNKGYAEDAMAAARKAGAGGGTIIGARGTAKEGDAKFFGAEIVPEKDMLLILVPKEKCDDIVNAIQSLPCFAKAGSGIIFCSNAHDFTLLGKSEKAE